MSRADERKRRIIDVLEDAFADLMAADPAAFRVKYRKMAADPFAFYRGSACLFHSDVTRIEDVWGSEEANRIWIHGDLHAENFGTYMNADGRLVFDINDFDEAYIGHFSWDLRRFAASMALLGWQKALPDHAVRELIQDYVHAYLDQVDHYVKSDSDDDFALHLDNTEGPVHDVLVAARMRSRVAMLAGMTDIVDHARVFRDDPTVRRLERPEEQKVIAAFEQYLTTIPESKKFDRSLFYDVRAVIGKSGFGIGSAGLPAYTLLIEGYSQSLDNDVILSMKQANIPAVSRFVESGPVEEYFEHEGQRTVVSQRALQVHTDPLLGYTTIDGVGFVVSEVSPYEADLDWGEINEPDEMASVVKLLGRATAKIHCASDEDSEQDLVDFQTEEAIAAAVEGRRDDFVRRIVDFGVEYASTVRQDHALFVDAFREGQIGGVSAT